MRRDAAGGASGGELRARRDIDFDPGAIDARQPVRDRPAADHQARRDLGQGRQRESAFGEARMGNFEV